MGLKTMLETEMLMRDVRGDALPIGPMETTTAVQLEHCAERMDRLEHAAFPHPVDLVEFNT